MTRNPICVPLHNIQQGLSFFSTFCRFKTFLLFQPGVHPNDCLSWSYLDLIILAPWYFMNVNLRLILCLSPSSSVPQASLQFKAWSDPLENHSNEYLLVWNKALHPVLELKHYTLVFSDWWRPVNSRSQLSVQQLPFSLQHNLFTCTFQGMTCKKRRKYRCVNASPFCSGGIRGKFQRRLKKLHRWCRNFDIQVVDIQQLFPTEMWQCTDNKPVRNCESCFLNTK